MKDFFLIGSKCWNVQRLVRACWTAVDYSKMHSIAQPNMGAVVFFFFSGSRCSSKQWASTLHCTASWRRRSSRRLRRPSLSGWSWGAMHEADTVYKEVRIYVLIFVFFWMSNVSKCMHLIYLIHCHIPALCVVWRCFVGYCRMFLSVACCRCNHPPL